MGIQFKVFENGTRRPISAPTKEPTAAPAARTREPTPHETKEPTVDQTRQPTPRETKEPTVDQTREPTPRETKEPTVVQTREPTPRETKEPTLKPTASAPTYITHYLVNAGSPGEDMSLFTANKNETYEKNVTISGIGPYPEIFFQSHRWAGKFKYIFTGLEPRAPMNLTLGFAEIYRPICRAGQGARSMDITVNGAPFATNLDILALVPCATANFERGVFTANGQGKIAIKFNATVNNPFVSVIELDAK